ncbi:nucleotidyltransferase family protein [Fictibacillus fluitans]|uniref:Nucleotidyltransferase family protein n=1 Tax=Fictibacillus fluitans TaxID=3058422 RepID=A0ABT8HUA9_9BACL|nr:nucleotidyltransferase family protein [Fictibacillus sp. NE201]MDN4523862.1 nucleotidyltransferase family protein [Fictibacillus sp. NE201]
MAASSLSCILLAAGCSSRMNKVKALLQWQGTSLIAYQIKAIHSSGIKEIVVVLGFRAHELKKELDGHFVKLVINPDYSSGKCSSIRAGCHGMDNHSTGALIAAVDQPLLPGVLCQMDKFHQSDPESIIIPVHNGKRGHPILLPNHLYPELLLISEETEGLRNIIRRHHNKVKFMETDNPSILLNLNTPADYEAAYREDL